MSLLPMEGSVRYSVVLEPAASSLRLRLSIALGALQRSPNILLIPAISVTSSGRISPQRANSPNDCELDLIASKK